MVGIEQASHPDFYIQDGLLMQNGAKVVINIESEEQMAFFKRFEADVEVFESIGLKVDAKLQERLIFSNVAAFKCICGENLELILNEGADSNDIVRDVAEFTNTTCNKCYTTYFVADYKDGNCTIKKV